MKKLIFIGVAMAFCVHGFSQSFVDNALLFSRTYPGGSARIQALGGTQISLGGDYSSAASNPAGLGMYNRSEFTFSPAFSVRNTTASFGGNDFDESRNNLNIPGLSLVFHHETGKESGFMGGSFAITMSRINDINMKYYYTGQNTGASLIDYFVNDAYNYTPDGMLNGDDYYTLTGLAYNNYLIDSGTDGNNNLFYYSFLDPLEGETRTFTQAETIERKGAQNQWSIAYGANFSDKLFIGASIGIASLNYKLTQIYSESNFSFSEEPNYKPLDSYESREELEIKGTGFNFNLGLTYRPVDFIQVGAAISTPTIYNLNDTYTARIDSKWNNFDNNGAITPPLNDEYAGFDVPTISEYYLNTPFKFASGITFISKYGFISGDVELINYSKTKYSSQTNGISFSGENDDVKAAYTSVANYRVGAEFRYDIFRVRAGYNYMPDPSRETDDIDRSIQTITGGLGVKMEKFSIDMAIVNSSTNASRIPYSIPDVTTPRAVLDRSNTSVVFTVGFAW